MKKLVDISLLCVILVIISGCSLLRKQPQTTLYPIGTIDIETMVRGTTCTIPEYTIVHDDGVEEKVETHTFEAKKDGRFLSDFYIDEVMEAKLRE